MAKQNRINENKIISSIEKCVLQLKGVSRFQNKGIKLSLEENSLTVNMHIFVFYGINIPQLSYDIQSKVKSNIENIINYSVNSINVFVDGIDESEEKYD